MLRERDEAAAKQRSSTQAQLKEHLHLRDEAVAELLRAEEAKNAFQRKLKNHTLIAKDEVERIKAEAERKVDAPSPLTLYSRPPLVPSLPSSPLSPLTPLTPLTPSPPLNAPHPPSPPQAEADRKIAEAEKERIEAQFQIKDLLMTHSELRRAAKNSAGMDKKVVKAESELRNIFHELKRREQALAPPLNPPAPSPSLHPLTPSPLTSPPTSTSPPGRRASRRRRARARSPRTTSASARSRSSARARRSCRVSSTRRTAWRPPSSVRTSCSPSCGRSAPTLTRAPTP